MDEPGREGDEFYWPFRAVRQFRGQPEVWLAETGGKRCRVALLFGWIEMRLHNGEAFGNQRRGFVRGRINGHRDSFIGWDFTE